MTVTHSTVKGKRLFIDISSSSTVISSKKLWLLVVEDRTDYFLELLFKGKIWVENLMTPLLKDFKAAYSIYMRYIHCNNAGENETFEWLWTQEWWVKNLNTLCPVLHSKMGEWDKKLPLYSIEYMLCWMIGIFLGFWKIVYGLWLLILPYNWKIVNCQLSDLSHFLQFFGKWNRSIITALQKN